MVPSSAGWSCRRRWRRNHATAVEALGRGVISTRSPTSIDTITRKKTEATMSPMIFHVRSDPDDESDEDEEESLLDGEPEVFVSGRLEPEPALGFGVSGGISGC